MNASHPFLIVAVTGRALAASAVRGGFPVVVLDYFADRDTRAAARAVGLVARPGALRLDRGALLRQAAELAPPSACSGLVYGAGFEGNPALLSRLAAGRDLLGNTPAVVGHLRDPARFFPLLDRLGLPHPEVRSTAPDNPAGWLVKRAGGAGGAHIRTATRRPVGKHCYVQRHQRGVPHSVLFLADGRRARIIGLNRQWTAAASPGRPYLYGGAVGGVSLPDSLAAALPAHLDRLVAATGLVGLNGLDFLLDGDRWSVLELNPRPTATLDLYDPDFPAGLFALHLAACRGSLPGSLPGAPLHRAHAIVHAPIGFEVRADFRFRDGCRDLPVVGTRVGAGDPVCSVHAEGPTVADALARLRVRQQAVEKAIRGQVALSPA